MKDTTLIGTKDSPLRSSSLQQTVKCLWRGMSMFLLSPEDRPGPAADTGSATHAAVHMFHESKGDVLASIEHMHVRRSEYPLADLDDAARLFLAYTKDPRNHVPVALAEKKVKFTIKPAPEDPTGEPIWITGRLDQVRLVDGVFKVNDLKTSTRDGPVLLAESLYQMAAYCVGATLELGKPVHPGALILPRKYMRAGVNPAESPPGVFWHYVFRLDQCDHILNGVRHAVAMLRSGCAWANPGDYCTWCHFHSIDECIPKLVQIGVCR